MGWEGIKQRFRGGSTKSRRQKETIEFLLKELEDLQEEKANLEDECAQLRVSNWNTNQEYRVLRDKLRSAQQQEQQGLTSPTTDDNNANDDNDDDNDLLLLFGGNAQKRLEEIQTRRLERNLERFQRSFKGLDESSSEIPDDMVKHNPMESADATAAESSSQVGESAAAAAAMTTSSSSSQQTRSGEELSELDAVRRELSQTQRQKERLARELAHAKSDFQDVTETLQTCLKNMDKLSKLTKEKEAESQRQQQERQSHHNRNKTVEALCADLQQQEQDIGYLEHVIRDNLRMKLESIYEKKHQRQQLDDDDNAEPLRGVLTKQESAEMAREQHANDMLRLRLRHQSQLVKLHAELENKDREIAALQDDLTKSLNSMMSLSTELDKARSPKSTHHPHHHHHHGGVASRQTNHHAADTTSSVHDGSSNSSSSSNMYSHYDDNASDDAFIESMDRSRVEFMQELRVSIKSLDGGERSLDSSDGVVEPPPPLHRSYRGTRRSRHDDHDNDDDEDDDDDHVDFDEYDDEDDDEEEDDNSDLYDASDFAGAVKSHASVDSNEPVVGESVDAKDRTIAYLYAENGRLKHSFAMERTLLEEAIRVQAQQLSNLTGMQRVTTTGRPRPRQPGGGRLGGGGRHVSFPPPNVPRPIYEYEPGDRRRFDSDSS